MNTSKFNLSFIACLFIAFLFSASSSFAARLDGDWINIDRNTRGLTKVKIIGNNAKINAWGSCSPKDCNWGAKRMYGSGSNYKAIYNQGFAVKKLDIALLRDGRLCVIVKATYKDSRKPRTNTYFFKKKRPTHVRPRPVKEDCVPMDYRTAKVKYVNGRYKVVHGANGQFWAYDFGKNKKEAYKALHIIKSYRITQSCYVGRPGPSLEYVLANGRAPKGAVRGEDCVSFNPRNIQVKKFGNRYKIVDGNHLMFDFGTNKTEALKSLAIIKKYGFTKSCFVGRPNPSFQYLRK